MKSPEELLKIFLDPLSVCKNYLPKFGQGNSDKGCSYDKFSEIYGSDPFYHLCGIDSELMYKAHKVSGGMTSIYRQLGTGCERIFREIIIDATGYSDRKFASWEYKTKSKSGKDKLFKLDGRLLIDKIINNEIKSNVQIWVNEFRCSFSKNNIQGIVFEVRQGYKSKDSKRQNADIDNIIAAWQSQYIPVFAVFSNQIDDDIIERYKKQQCGIIVGRLDGTAQNSLFIFCREVLKFNLEGFFINNSQRIKQELNNVLEALLNV